MDILRERDQGGFGDRNEYGSRIGGGIDVSAGFPRWMECQGGQGVGGVGQQRAAGWGQRPADSPASHPPSGASAQAFCGGGHRPEWRDDQEDPE